NHTATTVLGPAPRPDRTCHPPDRPACRAAQAGTIARHTRSCDQHYTCATTPDERCTSAALGRRARRRPGRHHTGTADRTPAPCPLTPTRTAAAPLIPANSRPPGPQSAPLITLPWGPSHACDALVM